MIKITTSEADAIRGVEYQPDVRVNILVDINGEFFISNEVAEILNIEGEECEYIAPINDDLNDII